MRNFEVGDIIKYKYFYRGFNTIRIGIIASERKQMLDKSPSGLFGYDVLTEDNEENNEIVWILESYIEGKVEL